MATSCVFQILHSRSTLQRSARCCDRTRLRLRGIRSHRMRGGGFAVPAKCLRPRWLYKFVNSARNYSRPSFLEKWTRPDVSTWALGCCINVSYTPSRFKRKKKITTCVFVCLKSISFKFPLKIYKRYYFLCSRIIRSFDLYLNALLLICI